MCGAIHALIPPGPSTWIDLFCGSGIVTLKKERHAREVINDLNDDIINLFEVLRGPRAAELYRLVEMTPYSEELLYQTRKTIQSGDQVERAWSFLILSWFSRHGHPEAKTGFRWSKKHTTAPEITWARMPERLASVAQRLRGVCVRRRNAIDLIEDYDDPDCLFFIDPPYPGRVGRHYRFRMADDDHRRLGTRLARLKARAIMTLTPGTIYDALLSDWWRHEVKVLTGGQTIKPEVILTNFDPLPLLGGAS